MPCIAVLSAGIGISGLKRRVRTIRSPSAVSYTHLDVYKRQVLDQRGVAYYPEHLEELLEGSDLLDRQQKQLALQLLHQWPLRCV